MVFHTDSKIGDEGVAAIGETFPKLESLVLESGEFGGESLQALTGLKKLGTLHLRTKSMDDDSLIILGKLPSLTRLILQSGTSIEAITAKGLEGIARSKSLTEFDIEGITISPEGWEKLAAFNSLTTLNLRSIPITSEIGALSAIRNLQSITISGTPEKPGRPDEELIAAFKKLRGLKRLDLSDSPLAKDAGFMKALRETLPKLEVRG